MASHSFYNNSRDKLQYSAWGALEQDQRTDGCSAISQIRNDCGALNAPAIASMAVTSYKRRTEAAQLDQRAGKWKRKYISPRVRSQTNDPAQTKIGTRYRRRHSTKPGNLDAPSTRESKINQGRRTRIRGGPTSRARISKSFGAKRPRLAVHHKSHSPKQICRDHPSSSRPPQCHSAGTHSPLYLKIQRATPIDLLNCSVRARAGADPCLGPPHFVPRDLNACGSQPCVPAMRFRHRGIKIGGAQFS